MKFKSKKLIFAWCLYDWANSAFATVVSTFIISTYFTSKVATTTISGTALWGYTISFSGLAIALLSPIFGAIADHTGRRKFWLSVFTYISIIATALLWFAKPNQDYIFWTLSCVIVATIAFEIATVFYNAMLTSISPRSHLGRISGWAWGLGYLGGLACLCIILFGFVELQPRWLNILEAEHIRISGPIVAIWFFLFSLPIIILFPIQSMPKISTRKAVSLGLQSLWRTLRNARSHKNILVFLIARMLYTDGLNTLFAFGGIYAAGTFHLTIVQVIQFGIAMNISAGIGAISFAWLDDFLGAKNTILCALFNIIICGFVLLLATSKAYFIFFSLLLSLFLGPAQAASRSLMARLAPEKQQNEMFGLYALSGKVTAFLSPWLLSVATLKWQSQRVGMATILIFLVIGSLLMFNVRENQEDHPT